MQYKKGQVKILSSPNTGRDEYAPLEKVMLFPGTKNEISLGKYLENLSQEVEAVKKANEKLQSMQKDILKIVAAINLKQ